MGYSSYNYLGAYIELPEVEKTYKKEIRRCSDTNCSNHRKEEMPKDARFCIKCGTEIEEFEVAKTTKKVIDYYNFAQKHNFDPELFTQVQNDRKILIPNRNFGSVERWEEDEDVVVEFVWGDSRKAIVEYTKNAQEFIDKVKEVYGVDLQVKYGIVAYTM